MRDVERLEEAAIAEGRRKKDEVIIARVSAIKIVLTALAVAIYVANCKHKPFKP
ncbi:MAG TPA: hypothetical protein VK211_22670 [Kamptonema sp.]|nr:hypothetical protein [Kamptonema sp.]